LAHWLLTLLLRGRPGEAYNVGSDEVISIADLAHLVRDILAPVKPVHIKGLPDLTVGRNCYVPDILKIQRELDLRITLPLTESIHSVGSFYRVSGLIC
jgi:dTDP-glucose 4,6-dehydratase